jgi:hypothetical protein
MAGPVALVVPLGMPVVAGRPRGHGAPAISVEQFRLTLDGGYISECLNLRRRDFYAIEALEPFRLRISWEQLDDGL